MAEEFIDKMESFMQLKCWINQTRRSALFLPLSPGLSGDGQRRRRAGSERREYPRVALSGGGIVKS